MKSLDELLLEIKNQVDAEIGAYVLNTFGSTPDAYRAGYLSAFKKMAVALSFAIGQRDELASGEYDVLNLSEKWNEEIAQYTVDTVRVHSV